MTKIAPLDPASWKRESKSAGFGCHLYVIEEGHGGPCKVGIARNAFWRRGDLQTGNWRPLFLRAVFVLRDRADAVLIEAATLSAFEAQHLAGEWLSAPCDEIISYIQETHCDGAD